MPRRKSDEKEAAETPASADPKTASGTGEEREEKVLEAFKVELTVSPRGHADLKVRFRSDVYGRLSDLAEADGFASVEAMFSSWAEERCAAADTVAADLAEAVAAAKQRYYAARKPQRPEADDAAKTATATMSATPTGPETPESSASDTGQRGLGFDGHDRAREP
jgi:hypothetical protein